MSSTVRRRRSFWGWTLFALLALAVTVAFGLGGSGAGPSSLGRGSGGWLAARLYLERRGAEVEIRDKPLDVPGTSSDAAVWVLALPFEKRLGDEEAEALHGHLRAGGTVLVAYPRRIALFLNLGVLDALGLAVASGPELPPLAPWRWWSYHRERWLLPAEDDWSTEVPATPPELAVAACRQPPEPPSRARILYQHGGEPLVYTYRLHHGRVVVMPADVLSNGFLLDAGNADFLETLLAWLGPEWSFDEYHHGLVDPDFATSSRRSGFAWDLFMAHLALIYVLALVALVRRFGPAWREPPVEAGSTAAFLRNLGALHRELGHWDDAARLLVERSRALDPSVGEVEVPAVVRGAELVALGRRLASSRHVSS